MFVAALVLGTALHAPSSLQTVPSRHQAAATRAASGPMPGGPIVVGTQRLVPCRIVVPGYCGRLTVPLNWLDRSDGTISIRYQWLPSAGGPSSQTIVAEEGGPGYATTESGFQYRYLFEPLLRDHNLLMMDQRGTGGSDAIDCPALQPYAGGDPTIPFQKAVSECGDQLNHRYRDALGQFVHASDLFGTSASVRDLAAILGALGQKRVDLYGDSYGSFFAQVFASRYPDRLHAVVLDSTYPTIHQDPFDRAAQEEIRFGFSAVCARSLACSADTTGSPLARLARLDAALDAQPLDTTAYTPIGQPVPVRIAGPEIWSMLSDAGDDFGPYRNIDAATRAYLDRNDPVPLARLYVWTLGSPTNSTYSYASFSEGLYVADTCTVYKTPFDMQSSLAQRRTQYQSALAALPPSFGYPLSNRDVFASPAEGYNTCITWPAPVQDDPIITKQPPLVPPSLPVLILSGDLDETTSPGDNRQAAAALGPSVTFVDLPNSIHTSGLLDPYNCASALAQQFFLHPASVNTSCRRGIPEVRTVGVFPLTLSDQPPATALPGNTANANELRLAAIAVEAIGDALQGAYYAWENDGPNCGYGYCGPGLRGGRFHASANLHRVELAQLAYSRDTRVSGTALVGPTAVVGFPGLVSARGIVAQTADGSSSIQIDVRYDQRDPHALATIFGRTAHGALLRCTIPAP